MTTDESTEPEPAAIDEPCDDRRPGLQAPRFRLMTLFLVVALAAVAAAAVASLSLPTIFVSAMVIMTVIAHVAGASIGSTLRDQASDELSQRRAARRKLRQEDFAPTTSLSKRQGVHLATMISTVCGALLGAGAGAVIFTTIYSPDITWPVIACGSIGAGVLGGIFGFAASGFIVVMIGVGRETH